MLNGLRSFKLLVCCMLNEVTGADGVLGGLKSVIFLMDRGHQHADWSEVI